MNGDFFILNSFDSINGKKQQLFFDIFVKEGEKNIIKEKHFEGQH